MGNLPADISDMEGDFPYDFTMPTAIEISQLVQFNLVRCLMVAFPEYSWGDWMDLHGAEAGVTRKEAVAATGTVSVTAAYGTVLAAGTVFAVPATDQMEAVEFQTLRTVTFAENETMDLAVEAVTPGVSGNVPANTITIMASPINGVTAITNSEKTSGGAEEENDEDFVTKGVVFYQIGKKDMNISGLITLPEKHDGQQVTLGKQLKKEYENFYSNMYEYNWTKFNK